MNKKNIKRQCNSAKNGRNIKLNKSKEKGQKFIKKKEFTDINNQYKKIKPINVTKETNFNKYINYNQITDSSSDNEIQKNYGTAEDSINNNDRLKYRNKFKNKINSLKKVNSFLLTNKKKMNSLKQDKIIKNNSQYALPLVNNQKFNNERKHNRKIILENNLYENIMKEKNNNLTLDLNHNKNDLFNINSCKNKNIDLNSNNKKRIIYQNFDYNFNTEKGKKLIPNHPIKNIKPIFNTKELNKNQNYYISLNNLNNQENEIISNEKYNSNLLKKIFALSPKNEMNDKNIIIQNNNININNNYNIKKKCPFILNFNQKEKNESLENIKNNNKEKKELFPIINNKNTNINKNELKLPKLGHIPVICLSNKGNDEEINNKTTNLVKNNENKEIEPAKKMLINPIRILEKKESKIKLNPINSQIRITKLNDINNNAYK